MTYPYRRYRFARALAVVALGPALWSALLLGGTAHGAPNVSVDALPDFRRGIPADDASLSGSLAPSRASIDFGGVASLANPGSFSHLESPSGIAFNLDPSGSVDRGFSQLDDFAAVRKDLAVDDTASTSNPAAPPIPEPTEYMLLAGGLLILWAVLRWKNRARRTVNAPRSRPKR